jgi:hypothetical protein
MHPCMIISTSKNGSFTFIDLYFINVLVFPYKFAAYVYVILQVCHSRKKNSHCFSVSQLQHVSALKVSLPRIENNYHEKGTDIT